MAIQIPQFTLGLAATTFSSSNANTAAVDFNTGNVDAAVFHIQTGTHAASAASMTIKVQESDDNSVWVDVTGGSTTSPTGGTADNSSSVVIAIKRTGRRRYVRLNIANGNANNYVVTYVAAAGLNGSPNDPITPAKYSLLVH